MSPTVESPVTVDPQRPWPQLLAFTEAHQRYFGGREEEIEALFRCIRRDRLTILFGLSGVGKSSILGAGICPRLRDSAYFPVFIRFDFAQDLPVREQIRLRIMEEGSKRRIEVPRWSSSETLWQSFHHKDAEFWDERNRLLTPVLIFDQFEDLFTQANEDVRPKVEAFLDELSDLVSGNPRLEEQAEAPDDDSEELQRYDSRRHRYHVVFALRQDFLANLQSLSDRFRSIFSNRYWLQSMDGEAALRSVLATGKELVTKGVAERIIRVLGGEKDPAIDDNASRQPLRNLMIEPTLLSLFFSELNEQRIEAKKAKIEPGPLDDRVRDEILGKFYDRSIAGVDDEMRVFIEDYLVTQDGRLRDFISLDRALGMPGVTEEKIQLLADRRLIHIERVGKITRIELAHDVLAPVIAMPRERRIKAELARKRRKKEAKQKLALDLAQKQARRARIVAAVMALLIVGIVVMEIARRIEKARAAQKVADQAYTAALMNLELDRPAQALAYAACAVRANENHSAAGMLLSRLLVTRAWPVPVDIGIKLPDNAAVEIKNDGSEIVAVTDRGLEAWDAAGKHLFGPVPAGKGGQPFVHFSSDDSMVIVLSAPDQGYKSVEVFEAKSGKLRFNNTLKTPTWSADVTPGGRYLALLGPRSSVVDLGRGGAEVASFQRGPGQNQSDQPIAVVGSNLLFMTFPGPSLRLSPAAADGPAVVIDGRLPAALIRGFDTDARVILLVSGTSSKMDLINADDGRPLLDAPVNGDGVVQSFDVSSDGRRLVVAYASEPNRMQLYSLPSGAPVGQPIVQAGADRVQFSDDGFRLLTTSRDGTIQCWNALTGERIAAIPRANRRILRATFTPDGSVLAVDESSRISKWRFSVPAAEPVYRTEYLNDLSASRDGVHTLATTEHGFDLIDTRTGASLGSVRPGPHFFDAYDGDHVVVFGGGGHFAWADLLKGGLQEPAWGRNVSGAVFSRDGQHLCVLTDSESGPQLHWVDVHSGEIGATILSDSRVGSYKVNRDGTRIAALSTDGKLKLIDATGNVIFVKDLEQPGWRAGASTGYSFSDDGQWLVTYESSAGVTVSSAANGHPAAKSIGVGAPIAYAALSHDSNRLLVLERTTAQLWDWRNGILLNHFDAGSEFQNVQLSADGRRLMWNGRDDVVRVWDFQANGFVAEVQSKQHGYLDASGLAVFTIQDGVLMRTRIPEIRPDDRVMLADLSGSIAGLTADEHGAIEQADPGDRKLPSRCEHDQGEGCSIARWLLQDPASRNVSPFTSMTLARFADVAAQNRTLASQAAAFFPGNAQLAEAARRFAGFDSVFAKKK